VCIHTYTRVYIHTWVVVLVAVIVRVLCSVSSVELGGTYLHTCVCVRTYIRSYVCVHTYMRMYIHAWAVVLLGVIVKVLCFLSSVEVGGTATATVTATATAGYRIRLHAYGNG
jgi:hypothetical protein